MTTVTKKGLVDQVAVATKQRPVVVKRVVQSFLDGLIVELGKGNRLEFRDFGVFEVRQRMARKAMNPKTLAPVDVPPRLRVKFKGGRVMKRVVGGDPVAGVGKP